VGSEALIGAGALVTEGQVIPSRHMALGVPARVFRELTEEEIRHLRAAASHYVTRAQAFRTSGQ
jgi:carbonic anhydrase/acetyltransferase-like protein (isoleucine patch superfamily)